MSPQHCSQPELYHGPLFHDHERRTRTVVTLTFVMMIAEIIGGLWLGSMALLADGFHMATHVGALGISAFAYAYARNHAQDAQYTFGTGKVSDLAGFASAIILSAIAIYILFESGARLFAPVPIIYGEAITIAVLGLGVNLASAYILHGEDQGHTHSHDHDHGQDNNFRAAYIHVLADAVTSVLAIIALSCGWCFGWRWMDPAVGIIGAFVILSWARSLLRDTAGLLLDRVPKNCTTDDIRAILTEKDVTVSDIHIWRVGPTAHAVILAINVKTPTEANQVREWLKPLDLAHVTVEINLMAS